MRSWKGKHVLPGMCYQYDRLHRQRTHPNTNGAAGRTERKRRQSRCGEADLMALTENGEAGKKPEICNCTEKCEAGKVNTSCPVCVTSMTGCTGKEPTPTPTEQPVEPKEKGGNPGVVLALVLFALLGGGAAFYYFKFLKPKQNVKGDTDLEDFEFEDYDEDEPEADTGETPEDEETEEETL